MLKCGYRIKRGVFAIFLMSICAFAGADKPTQEFWDYMMEFGDEQGEILDPLDYNQIEYSRIEYNQIHALKEEQSSMRKFTDDGFGVEGTGKRVEVQTKQRPTTVTSSSSRSSRVSVKGAAL